MTALHAPDAPGEAAHAAAMFASVLAFNLLAAASPTVSMEQRLAALERLFTCWPPLCREMKRLEDAAPQRSAAGYALAALLADFADSKTERPAA